MRIHCLQHVAFEGPAAIADWARAQGHTLSITRLDRGEPLPRPVSFDWLVIMGGPMGVGDTDKHPWLGPETQLIAETVDAGKRILGICLGAQLLAHALGAQVYPAPCREIGWFEVEALPVGDSGTCDVLPARFTPLHWHGDTFDLPAGVAQLARSPACEQQAFQYGDRAIGLQFHLESTPDSVAALVAHCAEEIGDGAWEMPADTIRDCASQCAAVRPVLDRILSFLEGTKQ